MSLKISNVYYIDRRKGRTTLWPNLKEVGHCVVRPFVLRLNLAIVLSALMSFD
jgi:hypothetical protein